MPLVSIYGTVYNNSYIIEDSIVSLYNALPDFEENYELVIVDNYSTDGTWEKLLRLRRVIRNMKLIRYRCSRGKGRDIALRYTNGDYVMYADFDCIFSNELGIVIEKLRKVCTKGELWNLGRVSTLGGFSKRETMIEQIGGWRDLNFGEDWELLGRAVKRGVKLKTIAVKSLATNVRIARSGVYGEKRYVRSKGTYALRKLRNLRDVAIGWNLNPAHVIFSSDGLYRPTTFALLILAAMYSLINAVRGDVVTINTKYQVYASTKVLFPEEVGLPKEWFYIYWEDIDQTWPAIAKHLREILRKDTKIHIALLPRRRLLINFRDYKVFKKALEEYAFSTSHKGIGKIMLKH